MGSAFSGNGATEAVNIYMIIVAFVVDIKFVVYLYVVFGLLGGAMLKVIPETFARITSRMNAQI